MARVVLGMSGGVDSSVAAHLLCAAGHEVIGAFMRHGETAPAACGTEPTASPATAPSSLPVIGLRPAHKQGCCSASDAEDARRVADRLNIPFYALDFQEEFGRIIDYFIDEYTAARTPNPCVACNHWLKFGRMFEYADSVGADYVATGHYARLLPDAAGQPALVRGIDPAKDQSYVLFCIERNYLPRMLLPVGGYRKEQIRQLASGLGLRVADKRDSQEICFVPDGDHAGFIRRRRSAGADLRGEIVTVEGQVVGQHDGLERFTIGQRKGLGVALGDPRFVVRLEASTRRVVIGTRAQLARQELTATDVNWLVAEPVRPLRCQAQIRYNSRPAVATATPLAAGRLQIAFEAPQHGVAPGQAVVCYDGDRVLGGGWIE